jgi:hypothetical protein
MHVPIDGDDHQGWAVQPVDEAGVHTCYLCTDKAGAIALAEAHEQQHGTDARVVAVRLSVTFDHDERPA